jgi:DNA polymerase-4
MMIKDINKEKPMIMHIDLNSAFATTEQQAHPSLRGRPIGVTNRLSKQCCVIAASYEAKALGIKVGTRLQDALAICPDFIMLESDPSKYKYMYKKLVEIMQDYSPTTLMKSIDEGIIDFHGLEPVLKGRSLEDVGFEIKQRVKENLGEWMRINVGIGPNRFLAKEAAGWHKPDGLDTIDHRNLMHYYKQQKLTDLSGIAERYEAWLNAAGIFTPIQFLEAEDYYLHKRVFKSINGRYWHQRLRGYEVDDFDTKLGMVGRQWVVSEPTKNADKLYACLSYLCETAGAKLRFRNVEARGVCVWFGYQNGESFKGKIPSKTSFFSNQEIYRRAMRVFNQRPHGTVTSMGVYCYMIEPSQKSQLELFEDISKIGDMTEAMDEINERFGMFSVHLAASTVGKKIVKQKIPFNGTQYFDLLLKKS